jgi:uracil-DNA glycosylase family 4
VRVLLSVGGADSNAALCAQNPDVLAEALAKRIENFHYDGIDVDWEAPENAGEGAKLSALMQALRRRLPHTLLTMAVPAEDYFGRWFQTDALLPAVDWLNVMTYDLSGPYDGWITWFNAPVPSFGDEAARLLIVGLAPGMQGANRTGRPFTGDYAGALLYATLLKHHLARGSYLEQADDGLELVDCAITNAARCVPPKNKPLPIEINTCRQFLKAQIEAMPHLHAILALGRIAHDSVCDTLGAKKSAHPFGHGNSYTLGKIRLIASYHCSRYNTNTGVLTEKMFDAVVKQAKLAAMPAI